MTSSGPFLSLFRWKWTSSLRGVELPAAFCLSVLACYGALKGHPSRVTTLLAYPGVFGVLSLLPLLFATGSLSNDIVTRRAALWHSLGVRRGTYVCCQAAFVYSQVVLTIMLPVMIAVGLLLHGLDRNDLIAGAGAAVLIASLQQVAALLLLSSVLPTFWNAVAFAAVTVGTMTIYSTHQEYFTAGMEPHVARLFKTLAIAPWDMVGDAAGVRRFVVQDTVSSLLFSACCVALSVWVYGRRPLVRSAMA